MVLWSSGRSCCYSCYEDTVPCPSTSSAGRDLLPEQKQCQCQRQAKWKGVQESWKSNRWSCRSSSSSSGWAFISRGGSRLQLQPEFRRSVRGERTAGRHRGQSWNWNRNRLRCSHHRWDETALPEERAGHLQRRHCRRVRGHLLRTSCLSHVHAFNCHVTYLLNGAADKSMHIYLA